MKDWTILRQDQHHFLWNHTSGYENSEVCLTSTSKINSARIYEGLETSTVLSHVRDGCVPFHPTWQCCLWSTLLFQVTVIVLFSSVTGVRRYSFMHSNDNNDDTAALNIFTFTALFIILRLSLSFTLLSPTFLIHEQRYTYCIMSSVPITSELIDSHENS
jgi:hypothetical protein